MTRFPSLVTRFTEKFRCEIPIILPPMGGVSGPRLAAAMINDCGGFAFLGTGGQNPFNKLLSFEPVGNISKALYKTQVVSLDRKHLGVGLVCSNQLDNDATLLDHVIMTQPENIWITGENFHVYLDIIKKSTETFRPVKTFVQVCRLDSAIAAAREGADVIVLRGKEAGGPVAEHALPLSLLLKQAKENVSLLRPSEGPMLAVAGGVFTGQQVADYLVQGADAVCLGSSVAHTEESDLPFPEKIALVRQKERTRVNPDDSLVTFSGPRCLDEGEERREEELRDEAVRLPSLKEVVQDLMIAAEQCVLAGKREKQAKNKPCP